MSEAAALAEHGGRLCVARALYPRAPEPWIDLSTGINPRAYPAPRASAVARGRLPTPEEIGALEQTAAQAFGVPDAGRIVAAAGSEAVLRLMPYALRLEAAVVVGPTYSSHEAAWRAGGARFREALGAGALTETEAVSPHTAVTLINPNNPDGAITSPDRLLKLHDDLHAQQSYLIVDEAFADTDPTSSVAAFAGTSRYPHLIVLRSFGKFYGLAGVRLGFVIAAPSIAARFRELLGDWPVSADAIAAGLAAYGDSTWANSTRERLRNSARRLDKLLISSGFKIVGGTPLFRLARSDSARERFETLLSAGILARPFAHDPTLLRFGLPHAPTAWRRLAEVLRTP